jgi:nucleotide-binding universal stress UspA family protein
MKVLNAYDGSAYADAALDDLRGAGLPRESEALIVSVSESLVNPSPSVIAGTALTPRSVPRALALAQEQAAQALEEAKEFAAKAGDRVRSYFLDWEVRAEGIAGTPSQELIEKADEWKPDLIVVGSQGRSALGRFFLGSVSKKLATESRSSVRVVRRTVEKGQDAPPRVMIGLDGSPGAERAVHAVGRRVRSGGTAVRIVAVDDSVSTARIARILPKAADMIRSSNLKVAEKAQQLAEWAESELDAIRLRVSVAIEKGEPQRLLIKEARKWRPIASLSAHVDWIALMRDQAWAAFQPGS